MKICERVYGFMIIGILLGGLFITSVTGLWQASPKGFDGGHDHGGKHRVSSVKQ